MYFCNVQMQTGTFSGEKIGELVKKIINGFAEEGLSRDEAIEVLEKAKEIAGEVAVIKKID